MTFLYSLSWIAVKPRLNEALPDHLQPVALHWVEFWIYFMETLSLLMLLGFLCAD